MSSLESSRWRKELKKPPIEADSWTYIAHQEDIKYSHAISIENFSNKMQMEKNTQLKSKVFTIPIKENIKWYIVVCPNGYSDDTEGYLTVFLTPIPPIPPQLPIMVKIDAISLVDKDESKKILFGSSSYASLYRRESEVASFGAKKFVSHSDLRNQEQKFLPNDTLTIHCQISIREAGSAITGGISRPLPTSGTNMFCEKQASAEKCQEDMGNIFNDGDGKFSDFIISCRGTEFKCHKAILAGRSTYFRRMLSHDMEEAKQNYVDIPDIPADIVKEMLRYIYTLPVDLVTNAPGLLEAAEKYDLQELKKMCEESLCSTMTTDNVLDMLVLADLNRAAVLKSVALRLIVDNGDLIVAMEGWRNMMKKYPEIISDMFLAMTQQYPSNKRRRLH